MWTTQIKHYQLSHTYVSFLQKKTINRMIFSLIGSLITVLVSRRFGLSPFWPIPLICIIEQNFITIVEMAAEIAIYSFFKMVVFRHLGFAGHILRQPQRVFGGFYHCAKFSRNCAVVSIIQKFEFFACIAGKCLFTLLGDFFLGEG